MLNTPTFRRGFFLAIAGIVGISAVGALRAQAPAADAKPSAFEVASVKLNNSGRFALMGGGIRPGDRVTFINMPLDALIREAYSDAYQTDLLVGGPDWMADDRFDITPGMSGHFNVNVISTCTCTSTALPSLVPGLNRHCSRASIAA